MEHHLRTIGLDFLESALHRFVFEADIAAPRAEVFAAISADPTTWTWFPGLDEGRYEGPEFEAAISTAETVIGDVFRQAMANLSAQLSGARG